MAENNKSEFDYPWLENYPSRPNWNMNIKPRLMNDVLDETVEKQPSKPAIDFLGKQTSWADLQKKICHFATGLQKLGLNKGDKVGLFLPNCTLYMIAYYGILRAGCTVVNFNPLYAHDELVYQIEDSEIDIMVTHDLAMLLDKMDDMLEDTRLKTLIIGSFAKELPFPKNMLFPVLKGKDIAQIKNSDRHIKLDDFLNNDGKVSVPEIDLLDDVAVLQYTGGTTGVPKGAMLTHANIFINTAQCHSHFPDPPPEESGEHEKMLAVLPFFHVFSMTVCLNLAVLARMEIVTLPRFDLNDAMKLLHNKKPQFMPAVPAIFNAITAHPKLRSFDVSSLRFCISGGAPLPLVVKKAFESKTGCTVVEGYGLSESSPVVSVNPTFGENIAGSIGMPLPDTVIEIIDREDKVTPMPLGERGEVCIRGPQVMKGYYNKPKATENTLRKTKDGDYRLHTGDIGIMDNKGYIYIVDRIKDLIITNGYNVYPRNIEEAIYKHPNVEECIVAGLPDSRRGEIVKAWIKLKEGREMNAEELQGFLEDKISRIEMPKKIEFRKEPLPKTLIGKLSRKDIVAQELEKI